MINDNQRKNKDQRDAIDNAHRQPTTLLHEWQLNLPHTSPTIAIEISPQSIEQSVVS
jgi:hypothetical protein